MVLSLYKLHEVNLNCGFFVVDGKECCCIYWLYVVADTEIFGKNGSNG